VDSGSQKLRACQLRNYLNLHTLKEKDFRVPVLLYHYYLQYVFDYDLNININVPQDH